jgi:microcystin-dependent protein
MTTIDVEPQDVGTHMVGPIIYGTTQPIWMQPATGDPDICYAAQDYRYLLQILFPAGGVAKDGDCLVTQHINGDNTVVVTAGGAIVPGTSVNYQGNYMVLNPADIIIQPPGAPANQLRYDAVVMGIEDGQVTANHEYRWFVQVVSGAENADPVPPTLANDTLLLALIVRRPGVPNILNADIRQVAPVADSSLGAATAGMIDMFAGDVAPRNWALCNGQAISRQAYPKLFAVVGTKYGAGDGQRTFNVPNMSGRFPLGVGGGHAMGQSGGAEAVTLTEAEMPSHQHDISHTHAGVNSTGASADHAHYVSATVTTVGDHLHNVNLTTGGKRADGNQGTVIGGGNTNTDARGAHNHTFAAWTGGFNADHSHAVYVPTFNGGSDWRGGQQPHNNMPPYVTVNYIIRLV